jgi:hypothetical protein
MNVEQKRWETVAYIFPVTFPDEISIPTEYRGKTRLIGFDLTDGNFYPAYREGEVLTGRARYIAARKHFLYSVIRRY